MTDNEKMLIPQIIEIYLQLQPNMQERLLGLGQGMLLAGGTNAEGRISK